MLLVAERRAERREQIAAPRLRNRAARLSVDALERVNRILPLLGHVLVVNLVVVVLRSDELRIPSHEPALRQLSRILGIGELALLLKIVTMESFAENVEHLLKLGQRKLAGPRGVDRIKRARRGRRVDSAAVDLGWRILLCGWCRWCA